MRAGATTSMRPSEDSSSTLLDIELDLSVSVPIVGKSLEERAMARADRAIADEEARGTAWLAEH